MAVKKSLKNLKFDEALAMLEEKVKLLEDGSLPWKNRWRFLRTAWS